jgi:hypothetical protein
MGTSSKRARLVGVAGVVASAIAASAMACGGATPSGFANPDGGANDGDGGGLGNGEGGPGLGTGDGSTVGPTASIFYVHTNDTLYTVDPANVSAAPKVVGKFDCIGSAKGEESSMTDVAVAKDGSLYAVSQTAAHPLTITGSTVHCAATWPLSGHNNFYGLTVAPENTVSTEEVLIAADDGGALWQIDPTSGNATQVGTLGIDPITTKPWELSGDIVFLANGGSPVGFATVRVTTSDAEDTLIEVDVTKVKPGTASTMASVRGKVIQKASGCAAPTSGSSVAAGFGFKSMYGIAAYQDKVYGFSHQGDIVEIDNTDGSACLLSNIGSSAFSGAGVTTSAPVIVPR